MWIITPRGFYSAVAKPDDGDEYVTVRARSERDIRNLADLIDAEPQRSDHSDYRWRIRCRKDEWAQALADDGAGDRLPQLQEPNRSRRPAQSPHPVPGVGGAASDPAQRGVEANDDAGLRSRAPRGSIDSPRMARLALLDAGQAIDNLIDGTADGRAHTRIRCGGLHGPQLRA